MATLPVPGASKNSWGSQLNEFLREAHNEDGTLKDVATETDFIALSETVDQVGALVQEKADSSQVDVSLNPDGTLVPSQVENAYVAAGGLTGPEAAAVQAGLARLDSINIDPRAHGAACDGVTDDTAAVQSILDMLGLEQYSGARILVPGHMYIPGTLLIKSSNVVFAGTARRNLQAWVSDSIAPDLADAPPTIIHDATVPLIKLSHAYPVNGFAIEDVTLVGPGYGNTTTNTIAIDFDLAGNGAFMRDFDISRVSIVGFYSAISSRATSPEGTGSDGQIGMVRVYDSNIMHNDWIARCDNSTWFNGFFFSHNDAGQNGYDVGKGGIRIAGNSINITQNILEGQRDPVVIGLAISGRSPVVVGNYFEANVGLACIEIANQIGPVSIGPNFYGSVLTDHKVLIRDGVSGGQVLDRWWPHAVAKIHPLPNAIVAEAAELALDGGQIDDRPFIYLDAPHEDYLSVPKGSSAILSSTGGGHVPAPAPFRPPGTGRNMPMSTITLSSTGRINTSYSGWSGTSGEIIVATWIYRLMDPRGSQEMYLQVSPDSTPALGYDGAVYVDTLAFRDDEWRILTVGVRAGGNWTNLVLGLYPYGINASGVNGKVVQYRPPTVYKAATVNDIQPFIAKPFSVVSAPAGGTWEWGDTLINDWPDASQPAMWVCTSPGTPGTWKPLVLGS